MSEVRCLTVAEYLTLFSWQTELFELKEIHILDNYYTIIKVIFDGEDKLYHMTLSLLLCLLQSRRFKVLDLSIKYIQ